MVTTVYILDFVVYNNMSYYTMIYHSVLMWPSTAKYLPNVNQWNTIMLTILQEKFNHIFMSTQTSIISVKDKKV
jgi:hypothetical protein